MSMIGKSLAHYEITAEIGMGGMGEAYEEFARDVDRVARFQRKANLEEIQALVIAFNTEDDPTNPLDLNILP
jgi:hypothetical protein